MKVSVVIPTYNGAHKIPTVLKALERQEYQDFETIVVVDGSTDDTLEVLKKNPPALADFRVIVQENQGRAAVRNRGAKAAGGDLLVFFDDDMRPEPMCIKKHVEHHKSKKGDSIAVGRTPEDERLCKTDFHFYKLHLSERWTKALMPYKGPLPEEMVFLTAQNFSVAKRTFLRLGGFDERLRDTEDYDLAIRAKNFGVPVYYLYDALSWHDDFFTMQRFIKRQQEYKKYHKVVAEINENYPKQQPAQMSPVKKGLVSLFKNTAWIRTIDDSYLLKVLPKPLRYKLYDFVVFAHLVD